MEIRKREKRDRKPIVELRQGISNGLELHSDLKVLSGLLSKIGILRNASEKTFLQVGELAL